MSCLLNIGILFFTILLFIYVNISTGISALEKNEDYNSMVTTALFEKLNWMIKEIKNVNQEIVYLNTKLSDQELKNRKYIQAVKSEVRELLQQQDIKAENLLLQMQQQVLKDFALQENLLKNTSKNVENLKLLDVSTFKQTRNWQTILRRQDGSQSFNRSWSDYKTGFGVENGEFFIGLETLHAMTTYAEPQELLIVLRDFANETRYAKYSDFVIGSEYEKYNIKKIGKYQGDAGDSLSHHLYCKFSTYDQDNDNATTSNCAQFYPGGWWFSSCFNSHLTGHYLHQSEMNIKKENGLIWHTWHGLKYSLKYAEMMIRAK